MRGSPSHDPLGNFARERLKEETEHPRLLPHAIGLVLAAYARPDGEEAEEVDTSRPFEQALFEAYYGLCAASPSRFLREWSDFDRTLRNVAAATTARAAGRPVDPGTSWGNARAWPSSCARSSASDFGLRGELPYIDAVIAAVNDESNLLEKEHKIDRIRWQQAVDLAAEDYFNVNAVLSYLVRINLVARWTQLDVARGRAMLGRAVARTGRQGIDK